ncbi:uncharacterized protein LOC121784530 isoform X2 [Salvia splendens]|uniref:uncharacterized protein LOC121784530 isoform X2 n=1 Tax=Salvia splendens TaxID=180675 RepID=UPI001C258D45|nr:uncharacterized protein LOC121784530 isoform X2 [Salvia splendens]
MASPSQPLNNVQSSLDSIMPWIGMYIAAASAVCALAMAADAFIAFRGRKYWLPCYNYWTLKLVEWRGRSLPFLVQNRLCKRLLRDTPRSVLNFCIGVQILFVSASKLVVFLSARFVIVVSSCFYKSKRPVLVPLLEGEPQLHSKILKNICNEADKLIRVGQKKQPKNLIQLLEKSSNLNGVGRFDSKQVPSLHSQEPPNCWSLPVVTLTAISLALIDVSGENAKQLVGFY